MGPNLTRVPAELLLQIIQHLENLELKQLRLVCKALLQPATRQLRFHRLYISPSDADIDTFLDVCNHDYFRERITEIVWDDCIFPEYSPDSLDSVLTSVDFPRAISEWGFGSRNAKFHDLYGEWPEADLSEEPPKQKIDLYHQYFRNQQKNMEEGRDLTAFVTGLHRLPNLRRIILTPDVHNEHRNGLLLLYSTPFVRNLPSDFYLPDMQPWLEHRRSDEWCSAPWAWEDVSVLFRGIREISKILASTPNTVKEFIINASICPGFCGISHTLFSTDSSDISNLRSAFKNLTRIDLAINGRDQDGWDWKQSLSPLLWSVLDDVVDLHHLCLSATMNRDSLQDQWSHPEAVLLCQRLKVAKWPRLQTVELDFLWLDFEDLLSFMKLLPSEFRLLALRDVIFLDTTLEQALAHLKRTPDDRLPRGEFRVISAWNHELQIADEEVVNYFNDAGLNPCEENGLHPFRCKHIYKKGSFPASERLETYAKPGTIDPLHFDEGSRYRAPVDSEDYQKGTFD